MPIRKFSNGRFTVKRFTAPGVGGGSTPAAPVVTNTAVQIFTESTNWVAPPGVTSVQYLVVAGGGSGGGGLGGGLDRNRDIIGHVRAGGTIKAGRLGEETKSAGGPMSLAQKLAKQAMSMQKKTPGADVPADKQIAQQMGEDTIVEHDDNEHEYDHEGEMAKTQLRGMMMHAKKLHDMLEDDTNLPEWVQAKITLASDYMQTAADYVENKDELDEETQIDEKYMGFKALKASIAAKGGARDAGAVAAAIGRKKYGKAAFQKAAAKGEKLGEEVEQIDEARINHREFASDGVMHPEMANAKYMKPGNHVDFYSSKNGDKLYGKVLKNDGKNVHIDHKGEVHKFRVSATAPHQMKEALDPVGHEDSDVNNDGKVDKNDKYLLNRRAAVAKAIKDKMAKKLGK